MMKRTVKCLVLGTVCCLLTACHWNVKETRQAQQPVDKKTASVAAFERIMLVGTPTIYYTQGDTTSVIVEAPRDLIQDVEVSVADSCLTVKIKDNVKMVKHKLFADDDDEVKVYVTSPDLIEATLSGSGDFKSNGPVDTDNLKIELKGSGDMDFKYIICDNISITLVGSGDIELDHVKAQTAEMELVGSGDLKTKLEGVGRTDIVLKGSGDVKVENTQGGTVTSDLRGSGDITLKGDVRQLNHTLTGSGDYHLEQLRVQK